jgi:cation:H+ antiporter
LGALIQILGGIALLALGGEGVIRGAVGVARRLGMSELLIGLTLVGFGTSTPELLTSVQAALAGAPGIAVGNVVGSNICNSLLIVGVVAVIRPMLASMAIIRRDGLVVIASSVLLVAIALATGSLTRLVGGVLLALLVVYSVVVWRLEGRDGAAARTHEDEAHLHDPTPRALWIALLFAIAGLALLVVGADLMVRGAVTLARTAGLSETVIGLTIVAVGTSLPELVASLAATLKGRADVAFGNVLGSSLFNVLGILGVTALAHPIRMPSDLTIADWSVFVGSAVLLLLFARFGGRVGRAKGAMLLLAYGGYLGYLLLR